MQGREGCLATEADDAVHDGTIPEGGHQALALEEIPQGVHDVRALFVPTLQQFECVGVDQVVQVSEAVDHRLRPEVEGHPLVASVDELEEPEAPESTEEVAVPRGARGCGDVLVGLPRRLHALVDLRERPVEPEFGIHARVAQRLDEAGLLPRVLGPLVGGEHNVPSPLEKPQVAVEHAQRQAVAELHGVRHALTAGAALELRDDRAQLLGDGIEDHHDVGAHHAHRVSVEKGGDAIRLAVAEQIARCLVVAVGLVNGLEGHAESLTKLTELRHEVCRQSERIDHLAPRDAGATLVADASRRHDPPRLFDAGLDGLADAVSELADARGLVVSVDELGFDQEKVCEVRGDATDLGDVLDDNPLARLTLANSFLRPPLEPDDGVPLLERIQNWTVLRPLRALLGDGHTVQLDLAGEHFVSPLLGRSMWGAIGPWLEAVLHPHCENRIGLRLGCCSALPASAGGRTIFGEQCHLRYPSITGCVLVIPPTSISARRGKTGHNP